MSVQQTPRRISSLCVLRATHRRVFGDSFAETVSAPPHDPSGSVCDVQSHGKRTVCESALTPAVVVKPLAPCGIAAMLRLSERASLAVHAGRLHRRLFSSNLSLIKTVRSAGRAGRRGGQWTDSLPPAP